MPDAVALFRPARPEALIPFLDLDDESEESDGIFAEPLEDGAYLLHTFQPFELFAGNPDEARAWLAQFSDVLSDVHDDPRGWFFFPDTLEPEAQGYDAVIAEVGDQGFFVALGPPAPALDMEALQAIAGHLMGAGPEGTTKPASSFEIARLLEGMQEQLLAALEQGAAEGADEEGADVERRPPSSHEVPPAKKPNG